MDKKLEKELNGFAQSEKNITILTGAGISAESNIPTFRGKEGYWTIGSKEYHPQEMATYQMFMKSPDEVWKWYLYRLGICKQAKPNEGHISCAKMEKYFPDRFKLITQNVDNLHLRAGSSLKNTYQIHGNIFFMRCVNECSTKIYKVPDLPEKIQGAEFTRKEHQLLICPDCGEIARPHVLWFDETYDEKFYHFHSSLKIASQTDLLIIVGTSGSTNLPNQIAHEVAGHNGIIVDINIAENSFSHMALQTGRGYFIKQSGSIALYQILQAVNKK